MTRYSRLQNDGAASIRSSSHGSARPRAGKVQGAGGQAGWMSCVINLVNTIVGAGVLAMPQALSHMGIFLGVVFILWAGVTAGFGLYLQTRCARYLERGQASFFALSQMTYPRASVLFDAAIAIKCFGVGVSYLIIIGDLMPGVVSGFSRDAGGINFLMDRHFWVTAFMLIVIPFSFLRRLDSLKYTSVIALTAIGYLIILVVAHFAKGDTMSYRGHVKTVEWGGLDQFLSSLPVMVFAYTCHQNMFSILNEIKDNSPAQTTSVVTASALSSGSVYVLVALTGYLSFGDRVNGNVVSMYLPSVASTIGKAAIVVMVMFSYPLQVHPCRASIDAVLRYRPSKITRPATSPHAHSSPPRPDPKSPGASDGMGETRFALITTTIIILSYIVAMTVSSLEKVLAYVGSTGSTSISFILPGLFFYRISAPDSPHHQRLAKDLEDEDEERRRLIGESDAAEEDDATVTGLVEGRARWDWKRRGGWKILWVRRCALALAVYGVLVMVVCLISNTYFNAVH